MGLIGLVCHEELELLIHDKANEQLLQWVSLRTSRLDNNCQGVIIATMYRKVEGNAWFRYPWDQSGSPYQTCNADPPNCFPRMKEM